MVTKIYYVRYEYFVKPQVERNIQTVGVINQVSIVEGGRQDVFLLGIMVKISTSNSISISIRYSMT